MPGRHALLGASMLALAAGSAHAEAASKPPLYVYEGTPPSLGLQVRHHTRREAEKLVGAVDVAFDSWGSFDGNCGYTARG